MGAPRYTRERALAIAIAGKCVLAGFRLLYGRPFTPQEYALGDRLSQEYGLPQAVRVGPIQVFGTGATINAATDNAVTRAAKLFGLSEAEVRNRCTISGGVKIARLPGAVQLSLLMPFRRLDTVGLGDLVRRQYGLA